MTQTKIFDEIASSLGRDFSIEEIRQKLEKNEEWIKDSNYLKSIIHDRIKRGIVLDKGDNVYIWVGPIKTKNWKSKKIELKFDPKVTLTNEESLKLFVYTLKFFQNLLKDNGITLAPSDHKYFEGTDPILIPRGTLSDLQYTFKRFAYHAQNSILERSINFLENEARISSFTKNYDPNQFINVYAGMSDIAAATSMAGDLGYIGLVSNKSDYYNYYRALKSIASYLATKTRLTSVALKQSIINDIHDKNFRIIYDNFKSKIPNGFGKALVFDILKEYDNEKFDYPKADLHVKRAIMFLLNDPLVMKPHTVHPTGFEMNADEFKIMDSYILIMNQIRTEYLRLGGTKTLTNYLFDKMIYLIGSGRLYLHGITNCTKYKKSFLEGLTNKDYRSIRITPETIAEINCSI